MTLASQMARSGTGMRVTANKRGGLSRGSRRRLRTAGLLLGLLVAAGGIAYWKFVRGERSDAPAAASSGEGSRAPDGAGSRLAADPLRPASIASPTPALAARAATPAPAAGVTPSPQPPPPVVLSMGSPGGVPKADDPPQTDSPSRQPAPASTAAAPAAAETPPPAAPTPAGPSGAWLTEALAAEKSGKLVEARALLSRALADDATPERDRVAIRERAARLNETLVFSPTITPGDPLSESYAVQSGDSLVRIARRLSLAAEPTFIARVNRMANPNRLSVGQPLKIVRGPFQAVVSKRDFRMDIYAGGPASPGGPAVAPDWVYIRSFRVGLGEKDGTPLGLFSVRDNSKLVNPHWVNPRTGEKFRADDPKNPIGERWIGLDGIEESTRTATGYGVHGTIEPDSIGREMSMGCVRLLAEDVELVYELLMPRVSTVRVVP